MALHQCLHRRGRIHIAAQSFPRAFDLVELVGLDLVPFAREIQNWFQSLSGAHRPMDLFHAHRLKDVCGHDPNLGGHVYGHFAVHCAVPNQ